MIEVLNSYLCHDCGSDHAISEVVYGKIKINMCADCIEKKEEQREYRFSELSDKAKVCAFTGYFNDVMSLSFDDVWSELEKDLIIYDIDGEVIIPEGEDNE